MKPADDGARPWPTSPARRARQNRPRTDIATRPPWYPKRRTSPPGSGGRQQQHEERPAAEDTAPGGAAIAVMKCEQTRKQKVADARPRGPHHQHGDERRTEEAPKKPPRAA